MTQTVSSNQLALGALDRVAMAHLLFERLGLLFLAALLKDGVMGADHQGAVFMLLFNTLGAQGAGRAGRGLPFKSIRDSARRLFLQRTALGIFLSSRTKRLALLDGYLELLAAESPVIVLGGGRSRAD